MKNTFTRDLIVTIAMVIIMTVPILFMVGAIILMAATIVGDLSLWNGLRYYVPSDWSNDLENAPNNVK